MSDLVSGNAPTPTAVKPAGESRLAGTLYLASNTVRRLCVLRLDAGSEPRGLVICPIPRQPAVAGIVGAIRRSRDEPGRKKKCSTGRRICFARAGLSRSDRSTANLSPGPSWAPIRNGVTRKHFWTVARVHRKCNPYVAVRGCAGGQRMPAKRSSNCPAGAEVAVAECRYVPFGPSDHRE